MEIRLKFLRCLPTAQFFELPFAQKFPRPVVVSYSEMVVSNVAVGYFQRVIRDIREAGRKRAKRSRSKLYTQK